MASEHHTPCAPSGIIKNSRRYKSNWAESDDPVVHHLRTASSSVYTQNESVPSTQHNSSSARRHLVVGGDLRRDVFHAAAHARRNKSSIADAVTKCTHVLPPHWLRCRPGNCAVGTFAWPVRRCPPVHDVGARLAAAARHAGFVSQQGAVADPGRPSLTRRCHTSPTTTPSRTAEV